MGRADGARRKQNGTKCPIGQKIFGTGAISGGIYSRLLSGADRVGLLAEREPDDGKGRLGGRRPCMDPGPTGRMCAAAAIFIREFRPAGAVAGCHFQLVSTDSGGRSPAGRGARRVSFEEQQEAVWRVALASYDPREMRVWMRYLEECNPAIRCTGYRTSQTLLRRLEQGDVDVLVLGGRLEDVDSIQFLPRLRGLARKPLVLLRDDGRNEKAAVESLSQEDACYLIRQATLEDMLRELRAPAHSPAESLEKRCERIYRSWGLNTSDANKRYLTGAVRVMMASDHRLAIRKEILGAVAQEHHLTIAAVDSALRRLLDTLDATGTQAWLDFRKEYGLERKRVTIGRLIYALESKLSQQEG